MQLGFLSPGLFDALVIAVIVVGGFFAVRRIRRDFQSGPRWPEDAPAQQADQAKAGKKGK